MSDKPQQTANGNGKPKRGRPKKHIDLEFVGNWPTSSVRMAKLRAHLVFAPEKDNDDA